jgi:small multidrug resistance family-3 protein
MWAAAGVIALGFYGFVAAFQPDAHFGRVLAAYGGVFIAGSLLWGMVADGFRPQLWDIAESFVSLLGVGLLMYAPR